MDNVKREKHKVYMREWRKTHKGYYRADEIIKRRARLEQKTKHKKQEEKEYAEHLATDRKQPECTVSVD